MRLNRNSLIALCVWLALVQGCVQRSDPSLDLTLAHEVFPQPPSIGHVTILLRLTDASGAAVKGARVRLEGNMSHPGMAPVFGEAQEFEPGRYQSRLNLSMEGDWVILVYSTLPDGRTFERQFEIKDVRQPKSVVHSSGPIRSQT